MIRGKYKHFMFTSTVFKILSNMIEILTDSYFFQMYFMLLGLYILELYYYIQFSPLFNHYSKIKRKSNLEYNSTFLSKIRIMFHYGHMFKSPSIKNIKSS